MNRHLLRRRVALVGSAGVAALIATTGFGVGSAFAAAPADPAGGSVPVAPSFNNGNVEPIRGAGSDTTFYMMQKIGDLYTSAGLYGCTLNTGASGTPFNSLDTTDNSTTAESFCEANANIDTTDTTDNWSRTEVTQGVDDVGSGAGQNQVCGALNSPLKVDFARSSKPAGTCSNGGGNSLVGTGYAKDGVIGIDFTVNPSAFGTTAPTSPYASVNGGSIGPVANGWLPGDPVNGTANQGTAFNNLYDTDNTGGANSTAYRLWCASDATRITDWGQLTNLGPNLEVVNVTENGTTTVTVSGSFPASVAVGQTVTGPNIPAGTTVASVSGGTLTLSQAATGSSTSATLTFAIGSKLAVGSGAPIGLPVRIMGMNPASGTLATDAAFNESGVSGGGCVGTTNLNAAVDPNPATAPSPNSPHISLENNGSQVGTSPPVTSRGTSPARPSRWRPRSTTSRTVSTAATRTPGGDHQHHHLRRHQAGDEQPVRHAGERAVQHAADRPDPVEHLQPANGQGFDSRLPELDLRLPVRHPEGNGPTHRC